MNKVVYYSINPPPGANTLVLDLRTIKPWHLTGIVPLTEADRVYTHFTIG